MNQGFAALRRVPGLAYLDSAATTLVHDDVAGAVQEQLLAGGSAGRGGHALGTTATSAYQGAREQTARLLGTDPGQLVFTASATDGLNLLAAGWGQTRLQPGHIVLTTQLEHHANVLPWREATQVTGAGLRVVRCDEAGDLDLDDLADQLRTGPRLLALTHVSNVTGATVPLADVVDRVRSLAPGCRIVVDGTQAVAHGLPDLDRLGVDAYVFSGHKAYGVLGAGIAWATRDFWSEVTPLRWGGGMVQAVHDRTCELGPVPWRFEGGTPNHPAAVGLAAGLALCGHTPGDLVQVAARALATVRGVHVLGAPRQRIGCVAFTVDGHHPHDIGSHLGEHGIAVRVGHLCAQPYLRALGTTAAVRASFGSYNSADDVERLVRALEALR